MALNLNNQLDFARATNSLAGNTLLQAQAILDKARGVKDWQIQEASFNNVRFLVFKEKATYGAGVSSATTSLRRRKATYKFPYVDGQTTDDMGRDGTSWSFDCLIFGNNYLDGLSALRQQFSSSLPGDLIHPIEGKIRCVLSEMTVTYEHNSRKAAIIKLTFMEHNFDIGSIQIQSNQGKDGGALKSAISSALGYIASIGSAIDTVKNTQNLVTSFVNSITQGMTDMQTSLQTNLININASFSSDGSTSLPAALPVNNGGSTTTNPTGTTGTASTVSVALSPNDPFASIKGTTSGVQLLTAQQAVNSVNDYRSGIASLVAQLQDSSASLDFYDIINTLEASAIALQAACEAGVQTSKPKILQYTVPNPMSARMVCFLNGIDPQRADEVDQLNPTLDSLNYIAKGTVLLVPAV